MMIQPRMALVVLFLASACAIADESTWVDANVPVPWQARVYWENDGIFNPVGDQDRHYTNGIALTFAYQPDWSDQFVQALGLWDEHTDIAVGVGISQQIYTATNISLVNPSPKDHPYAGYLYGSLFIQRENLFLNTDVPSLDHLQVDVGVVGTSAQADALQENIHRIFGGIDPQGWSNQLADEVAFQLTYRKKWLLNLPLGCDTIHVQVIPQAAISVGTVQRFIELGSVYRVGYNIPHDFGPGRLADFGSATALAEALRGGFYAYGYGRTSVQFVEWNTFLDGSVYHSSPFAASRPIVGEFQVGAALGYASDDWAMGASYAVTFFTDRYYGQSTSDSIAQMMLTFTGSF